MKNILGLCVLLSITVACDADRAVTAVEEMPPTSMSELADEYLLLELSMARHDNAHVDAYFGPPGIQNKADQDELSLQEISSRSAALSAQLSRQRVGAENQREAARIDGLLERLVALQMRIELSNGTAARFDDESRALFGAAAPDYDDAYFQAILDQIDALLGGEGDLSQRVNDFTNRFVVPPDRLEAVFDAAIEECRRRTLDYIELPDNESFSIEYVNDKPWSGYNWYQGNSQSLIQINTDLPIFISRAVDLGCHEGYPGHHTFNALLEKNLVKGENWAEFSLYPLFSPQSLIAEGSGNYGIELAFPGDDRVNFEKQVLYPLAGLDASGADQYYELQALLGKLEYAGNEAARDYLNGSIDRQQAVQWLVTYALSSRERAEQRVDFFDTYRSYVINYNLGKDMVRDYVERDTTNAEERWEKFRELLSSPMTAKDLR